MNKFKKISSFLIIGLVSILSCTKNTGMENSSPDEASVTNLAIEESILNDEKSVFYIDFDTYPTNDASLPIGVFDSGTGGLTVLDALVRFDEHSNTNRAEGSDEIPDFKKEKFIYLADQANMPYGNYSSEDKSDLLVEHIIKDVQFLLNDKYYLNGSADTYKEGKQKVKAIVIACNTATAYGKENVEAFIQKTGIDLKVIGVIDAGARGTLEMFNKDESGGIGVFATVGTIASKGYENTILAMKDELGYTGNIQVYNQGGHGIAEAVDEEPDFINRDLKEPREDYRGPSLQNADFKIDKTLLDIYNFDFDHNKMLCDSKETDDCQVMQINSADNYVRYHLVSLLEKIRKASNPQPLKALVLGCTHYPYLTQDIRDVLKELYQYKRDGKYIYRDFMVENVAIIDPSVNVARELYAFLKMKELFNPEGSMDSSEFYISVPNLNNENIKLDSAGRFTYEYKYGRNEGEIQEYTRAAPFSRSNIPSETIDRLRTAIPATFELISTFHTDNPKTQELRDEEKIAL